MCSRLKQNSSMAPKISITQKLNISTTSNTHKNDKLRTSDSSIIIESFDENDEQMINQNLNWIRRLFIKLKRKYKFGFVFIKEIAEDTNIGTCTLNVTETCVTVAKDRDSHVEYYFTNLFSPAISIDGGNIFIKAKFKDKSGGHHTITLVFTVPGSNSNWNYLMEHLKQFVDDLHPLLNIDVIDIVTGDMDM